MNKEQDSKKTTKEESVKKSKRKNRKVKISKEEEKIEKKKLHKEKISKKQEARLGEHIERVRRKEERGPAANKERFYVTNAKLLEQLNIWRESGKSLKYGQTYDSSGRIVTANGKIISEEENRIIPEEFGKMVKMIAERLTNHPNFKNYSYELKQDMISYACFKCIQGLHNYNFEFKNAFAYFTTACYNAFVSIISKYYKYKNLKRDFILKSIEKLEESYNINSSKILNQFIKEYLQDDFDKKPNEKVDNTEKSTKYDDETDF